MRHMELLSVSVFSIIFLHILIFLIKNVVNVRANAYLGGIMLYTVDVCEVLHQ